MMALEVTDSIAPRSAAERLDGALSTLEVSAASRDVLAHHGRSFQWGAVLLGRRQRDDASVVYAFCRMVDDAVDEAPDVDTGRERLGHIREMLHGRLHPHALVTAYLEVAERTGFGTGPADDLILGAESDLGLVRVESDAELLRYCYRVAGTVGVMMCGVLGVRDPRAIRHAIDLGIAMQLTNICRDVKEDAAMGRVYLPRARLLAAGAHPEELLTSASSEATPHVRSATAVVVSELLAEADQAYASGAAGYSFIPARPRLAVMVAAKLYAAIGHRLRRRFASDALFGRVRISAPKKTWLFASAFSNWLLTLFRKPPSPSPLELEQKSSF